MNGRVRLGIMLACGLTAASSAAAPRAMKVTVTNPTDQAWKDAPVVGPWPTFLGQGLPRLDDPSKQWRPMLVSPRSRHIIQIDSLDDDGRQFEFTALVDLEARETREFELKFVSGSFDLPEHRAYARMSLKGYDGVGWESDAIAYRIYWNLDNAMDVFGKSRPILSLDYWATPGVRHDMEDEHGIDVLKVARGIGIGGFGIWRDGKIEKVTNVMKNYTIRAAGPFRAMVDLEYVHWIVGMRDPDVAPPPGTKVDFYDLDVRMLIYGGQSWAEAQVTIKPGKDSPMPELVTGVPLHDETELVQDKEAGILGRWGNQALGNGESLKSGNLGTGVVVDPKQIVAFGEDKANTYVRLRPENGRVTYRYHASWFKEPNAATSAKDYEARLRAVAKLRPIVKIEPMPASAPAK